MITFKEYLNEAVLDANLLKRKPLAQRTPREQAFLKAAKAAKPPKGKVEVHLKHEDGTISKNSFRLKKSQDKWDDEAKEIAANHLKNMQNMHDQFPAISGSRATEVHKVVVK